MLNKTDIERLIDTFAKMNNSGEWMIPRWLENLAIKSGHSTYDMHTFDSINWKGYGL